MADATEQRRTGLQKPPLEAVAKDEERRENAEKTLVRALQSYINKLDSAQQRNANRETEIFCDYARENYASRAEKYLEAMSPIDPNELFNIGDLTARRDCTGLPTIGDVVELIRKIKVQRPDHWWDFTASEGDSPKVRRALRGLQQQVSFGWLLEEPWNNWFRSQLRDVMKDCVRDARKEYEQRFHKTQRERAGDISPMTLTTDGGQSSAVLQPTVDIFATLDERERAIKAARAKLGGPTKVAKACGVDYRDLRKWARQRNFAKGTSVKTTRIEATLLPHCRP